MDMGEKKNITKFQETKQKNGNKIHRNYNFIKSISRLLLGEDMVTIPYGNFPFCFFLLILKEETEKGVKEKESKN